MTQRVWPPNRHTSIDGGSQLGSHLFFSPIGLTLTTEARVIAFGPKGCLADTSAEMWLLTMVRFASGVLDEAECNS